MERKALGKGLGALIPGAERDERSIAVEIDVERVSVNPRQPRESLDQEKLEELVNSIRVHGVLQPIVVRSKGSGEYEVVAGERRLRAAVAAGLPRIPAVVRELTDEQSLQVALTENIQREDISPLDAASAYKRLIEEFGLSQEDIAFALGKSRSTIANTLRLLNLPDEVRESLASGRISEGHARATLALEDANLQVEMCRRIVGAGLSVRQAERLAREWTSRRATSGVSRETSASGLDPNTLEIEARLREVLGTRVRLIVGKDRGRIEIEFYTEEDLQRILNLLAGA